MADTISAPGTSPSLQANDSVGTTISAVCSTLLSSKKP